MDERITSLGVTIKYYPAKDAMKEFLRYMEHEGLDVVDMISADALMQLEDRQDLKDQISDFALVLAVDPAVLEASGVTEESRLKELREQMFLKLVFRYLRKNHKRVYLVVETEDEIEGYFSYFENNQQGIEICGAARINADYRADDMVVNAINGAEADCVVLALPSPVQEEFLVETQSSINAKVCLGIGKQKMPGDGQKSLLGDVAQYLITKIFKRKVEKEKNCFGQNVH